MLARRSTAVTTQRGAALIIALIVLATMLVAGAAMMRSVDTSVVIAGNLAFKQATITSGDTGIEAAVSWLQSHNIGATLHSTSAGQDGYVASRQDPSADQSWDAFWTSTLAPSNKIVTVATDAGDNTVSYIIHRMCNSVGAPTSASVDCSIAPTVNTAGHSKSAGTLKPHFIRQVYYRITSRIDGPRNTVSYVQAIVAM
jgi:type IV pilus assembly protein PilX